MTVVKATSQAKYRKSNARRSSSLLVRLAYALLTA